MEMVFSLVLVLLKATTISFVSVTCKTRWLFPHHATKQSTSSLYSVYCPPLTPLHSRLEIFADDRTLSRQPSDFLPRCLLEGGTAASGLVQADWSTAFNPGPSAC